jgi:hypothetical protein
LFGNVETFSHLSLTAIGFIPARKGLNAESSSGGQVSEGEVAALCFFNFIIDRIPQIFNFQSSIHSSAGAKARENGANRQSYGWKEEFKANSKTPCSVTHCNTLTILKKSKLQRHKKLYNPD